MSILLTVVEEDRGRADRLARDLRRELLGLDVDRADLVFDAEVPPGAKTDAGTITTIVIAITGSPVLVQLGRVLQDWVNRDSRRKLVVRDGDRTLEITGTTVADNREAIEAFFDKPT